MNEADWNWGDLPENVLSSILSNLFAKDRHSFSLTCKSWNQASKYSPFRHSPCLMYYRRNSCEWNLFQYNGSFSMSSFSMSLPVHINRAEIRCVKYGWMLMSCNNSVMFFFDPFNNQTIHLPKSDSNYATLCFFHPPTTHQCFIIGISTLDSEKGVEIGVLKRGENSEWRSCNYYSKAQFQLSMCTPVLHRGLVHCLDVERNVATFDIDRRDSPDSWTVMTKCLSPPRLRRKILKQFLVKLNEALLAVLVVHEEMKVHVYRTGEEPRMRWEPVEDLGNKVLFVSHTASFAATAPWRSMANRIYFPKMEGDGDVVFYCLKTRMYHSCNSSDYSSNKSYGLRDLNFATWIVSTPTPKIPSNLGWCSNVDVS